MKRFVFLVLFLILSGMVIIIGKIQYDKRIAETNAQAQAEIMRYQEELAERQLQEKLAEEKRMESLLANLTPELKEKLLTALDSGKPLKVVAMGSRSLTASGDDVAWPNLLEEQVNKKYGKRIFEVKTLSFGRANTFDVVGNNRHLEATSLNPDILIIEPFIWNDNGFARIEDTLYHVDVMVNDAKRENEELTIFIQPPNPLFGSTFFPRQVESVKEYSLENGLLYFDHWQAWPAVDDELLRDFIKEGDHVPNQAGHELWAEYIANYFTGK